MERKRNSKTTRRSSKRKKGSISFGKLIFVIFLLVLAGVGLYSTGLFSNIGSSSDDGVKKTVSKGVIAEKDADFTTTSKAIQDMLQVSLKKETERLETGEIEKRSTSREHTGGEIIWTTGNYFFQPMSIFKEDMLKDILSKLDKDASIYKVEADSWKKEKTLRYDIAIKEQLDGQEVYLVVARIYVGQAILKASVPSKETGTAPVQQKVRNGKSAKMAIILDDFGYGDGQLAVFNSMTIPLTYAVLPNKGYSAEAAASGYQHGKQIILHLPMQPLNTESSEPVHIRTDMSEKEIIAATEELTSAVPHIIGVNNHQGSRATSDRKTMYPVLQVLKKKGLFFVDSRTTSASIAGQTARTLGVATASNELFIDNDSNVDAIKSRLQEGADIAFRDGYSIVIGHDRANTASALKAMIPVLEAQGIEFVFVSQVLQ